MHPRGRSRRKTEQEEADSLEELGLNVNVVQHLLSSTTFWRTKLEWLVCKRGQLQEPCPNPEEVSEVHWMEESELRTKSDLLGSLPYLIAAKVRNDFVLE